MLRAGCLLDNLVLEVLIRHQVGDWTRLGLRKESELKV